MTASPPSPSARFGRDRRVRRRAEFDEAFESGRRVVVAHFVVLVRVRSDVGPARLGLVVSRKAGNAVIRNRIKRRLREAFRRARELPEGVDFVVIPRAGAAELEAEAVASELAEALRRAKKVLAKDADATHVPAARRDRPRKP